MRARLPRRGECRGDGVHRPGSPVTRGAAVPHSHRAASLFPEAVPPLRAAGGIPIAAGHPHSVATPRGGIRGTAGQPVRRFLPSLEGAGAQRGCQTPAPIFSPPPPLAVADPLAEHVGIEA